MKFERVKQWTIEAQAGLNHTLLEHERETVIAGVNAGSIELYRIDDGRSWALVHSDDRELYVASYQGEGAREFVGVLFNKCRAAGLRGVTFFSSQPAVGRLLRPLGFAAVSTVYRAPVPSA